MELRTFAEHILFEGSLAAKLCAPVSLTDRSPGMAMTVPEAPGRAMGLRFPQKGERVRIPLPTVKDLEKDTSRGILLHFFANHELLALELMALALLRFPEAPSKFRRGLAAIMLEEQKHLGLYLDRMAQLGVEFGQLPVNRYFWDVMADTPSPLAFVTQMSLTLEQANLDFSKYYLDIFRKLGDAETTSILETVYQDEIGHVGHGLQWFHAWRPKEMTDWEAYKVLLTPPLTPARAKGSWYDVQGRRRAGLSETFIQELHVYQHSKGRPPRVYWFNPAFEEELAHPHKDFVPGKALKSIESDLASLLLVVAGQDDVVLLPQRPTTGFLSQLHAAGFPGCQIINSFDELEGRLIHGFEPWGLSPAAVRVASSAKVTCVEPLPTALPTATRTLGSKVWAKTLALKIFPDQTVGTIARSMDEVLDLLNQQHGHQSAVIKAPYGTAGRNGIRVPRGSGLTPQQTGWLSKILHSQAAVIIEPWLTKVADFSVQIAVGDGKTSVLGLTRFLTNSRGQYVGHVLGRMLDDLEQDVVRAYHEQDIPGILQKTANIVALELAQHGYRGPAGMDALMYRDDNRSIHLYPIVEINTRYTMGRVALALNRRVHASVSARWLHLSLADIQRRGFTSFLDYAKHLQAGIELTHKNGCLVSGTIFTNDPALAQGVLSVLCVGSEAIAKAATLQGSEHQK